MMSNAFFRNLNRIVLCGLLLALPLSAPGVEETNTVASEAPAGSADISASNEALNAYLQLQQQIHETQLAIENTRRQAQEAAARNAEVVAEQLRTVERSLMAERTREGHFMVIVFSVFAGISFLAVVLTTYFQWRTVNHLADFSGNLPAAYPRGVPVPMPALEFGQPSLMTTGSVEQSSLRLLGAIERLEKRILELEHAAVPPLNGHTADTNGGNSPLHESTLADAAVTPAETALRTRLLIEKGQSLLNEDNSEAAIECFDEALGLDSTNTDALVKKGAALEKMRKLQEAIECYDRAIAADNSMTIAYLHKGGLYNRMERFSEAVECYEQALRTQEKRGA
jgi:tetratricopeptide (TPR) repeat protein